MLTVHAAQYSFKRLHARLRVAASHGLRPLASPGVVLVSRAVETPPLSLGLDVTLHHPGRSLTRPGAHKSASYGRAQNAAPFAHFPSGYPVLPVIALVPRFS